MGVPEASINFLMENKSDMINLNVIKILLQVGETVSEVRKNVSEICTGFFPCV